ncbi:hypothetical protein NLG97_g1565 [Lecanicillium saksenae]|uniref:Uncharacterized protein n=1 Tax=Lecanicillium saksenae TaxID=468837 RepID=A0ACC1R3F1_9HYPO|nr:hypothetical protein NLG97_g1565 [Lecanicillium saksenae]
MPPSRTETSFNSVITKSTLKILALASPAEGHTYPVLRIVQELVIRGYDVTFLAGKEFQDRTAAIGARFVPVPPYDDIENIIAELSAIEDQSVRVGAAMTKLFIEPTASRMALLYAALEDIKREDNAQKVVLLTESFYLGDHPLYLGAPLPQGYATRPRAININACCYALRSVDTGPFGLEIVPDGKPESRQKYEQMHDDLLKGPLAAAAAFQKKTLIELGARNMDIIEPRHPYDVIATTADITLQMCPPSLEYERSDVHPKVRFVGALPPRAQLQGGDTPPFWDAVTSGWKSVVVVSQGTVAVDYSQLLIPTIQGLAEREDVLVVAILGRRGAKLPSDLQLPSNAHVIDYLSYDAILPHAAAFIVNAGYGGFMHGIINGVPMVLAGGSEDKPEVANRGEFAGVAINLRTGTPSKEDIRRAVHEILSNPKYRKRVKEIQTENENMKAMDSVEKEILKWAGMD